jgi:hypothetical protein
VVNGDIKAATEYLTQYFATPGNIDFAVIVKAVGSSICHIVCEKFS